MMRAAAPPTAMPTMAPVESPELDESSVEGDVEDVAVLDDTLVVVEEVELGGRKAMAFDSSSERTAWMRWSCGHSPLAQGLLAQQPMKGGLLAISPGSVCRTWE